MRTFCVVAWEYSTPCPGFTKKSRETEQIRSSPLYMSNGGPSRAAKMDGVGS